VKLITMIIVLLAMAPCCESQCGKRTVGKNSYLSVTPSSGLGSLPDIDSYSVKEFINLKSKKDFSRSFGVNVKMGPFTVEHVPFGTYRIKIQSESGSEVFGRLIDVCDQDESVEVPNHFAQVHVVLLHTTASSVKETDANLVKVVRFRNVDGTEMKSLFKGAAADEVPYGSYDMELLDSLGGIIKRQVDVYQEDVHILSGIVADYGDRVYNGPENVVRGEVQNIPANERPIFVTMSGVYISYMINSKVSDMGNGKGSFGFIGVNPAGEFMLYTIGKSGILDAREFEIPRKSEITIDLSHPNPPKISDAP